MTVDRHAAGLTVLRIAVGVLLLLLGLGKIRWFTDASILGRQFAEWTKAAAPGSLAARYLQNVAAPHTALFARLVPLGEVTCGLALILGVWTWLFALVELFMVLNIHVADGMLFHYAFLTNGYGLPVVGALLALVIGGVRLPLSVRN
jgi:uncharacterized membrane protein YphA (DoxX/SURF4 family)